MIVDSPIKTPACGGCFRCARQDYSALTRLALRARRCATVRTRGASPSNHACLSVAGSNDCRYTNKKPAGGGCFIGAPGRITRRSRASPFGPVAARRFGLAVRVRRTMLVCLSQVRNLSMEHIKIPALRPAFLYGAPGRITRRSRASPFGPVAARRFGLAVRVRRTMLVCLSQVRNLSMEHIKIPALRPAFLYGAPGRIRTCDLRLRRPTLYPTELRAHRRRKGYAPASAASILGAHTYPCQR